MRPGTIAALVLTLGCAPAPREPTIPFAVNEALCGIDQTQMNDQWVTLQCLASVGDPRDDRHVVMSLRVARVRLTNGSLWPAK